ncbi:DUF2125 domain-containing protein [Ancylobacter sp. 6x-1]|uniref:DUF2125 domain-containing protein n=1 Tax=Ancylobacter crimeensis TaxID=2579147 RepID=A0ABT0DD33_9HYPH|nr:DUF2125 domain-containing protein [Ancylobacter crimeensis]MCK0197875.1 DUF2125 domain-containing protein [Ancylobacter crimeensis]
MSADTLPPRRRSPWIVIAPVALLLLAAAGWTVMWFYAAHRAQAEIDAWIVREAAQGRQWSCGERSFGGFPFRFELICAEPKLVLENTGTPGAGWTVTARRAHAVAQVWDPQHIIAEFEGPSSLTEASTGRKLDANWSLLQTSAVGSEGRPDRVSVSVNNYTLSQGGSALFAARHLEVHARHHPGDAGPTLDLAAGMEGGTGPESLAPGQPPVDGELQATITQTPEFRSMPPADRLRLWQQAGGRLKLVVGKLSTADSVLMARGDLGVDERLRPVGEVQLTVAGSDKLVAALTGAGLVPPILTGILPAVLSAGAPTEVDGKKGSSFTFTLRDGRVFMGFIPLGKIGPLY